MQGFDLGAVIDRPVAGYSGGQRRRLEIARALVSEPQVLFLDEPTVGPDTRIRYELLDLIAGLRARNEMTTLLTTHFLDEAERLCDRVAVVHAGTIVALDTPARLLARLDDGLVEVRVTGDSKAALTWLRQRGLADDNAFAVGVTLTVPLHGHSSQTVLHELHTAGTNALVVTTRKPTLDDVDLQLTGDRLAA